MKSLRLMRMSLVAACAGASAGGVAILILDGAPVFEGPQLASAGAAPANTPSISARSVDWDFILCHTPSGVNAVMTSGKVRLAATQTEAPQAASNAALPALGSQTEIHRSGTG